MQKTEFDFPLPTVKHPTTQQIFLDFKIPDWCKLKKDISDLSCIFSKCRWQSWDIAFTSEGWIPLELNYPGDIRFAQWAYTRGLKYCIENLLNVNIGVANNV